MDGANALDEFLQRATVQQIAPHTELEGAANFPFAIDAGDYDHFGPSAENSSARALRSARNALQVIRDHNIDSACPFILRRVNLEIRAVVESHR
jgi:hypothetical protein